jgi:hypothetical protein
MYVNPFWAGVIATFVAEFIACIIWATISETKKKK